MTDERTLDRLIAHLRAHVAELRRLEQEGAERDEVEERKRLDPPPSGPPGLRGSGRGDDAADVADVKAPGPDRWCVRGPGELLHFCGNFQAF